MWGETRNICGMLDQKAVSLLSLTGEPVYSRSLSFSLSLSLSLLSLCSLSFLLSLSIPLFSSLSLFSLFLSLSHSLSLSVFFSLSLFLSFSLLSVHIHMSHLSFLLFLNLLAYFFLQSASTHKP